jgi:hypothetical protein
VAAPKCTAAEFVAIWNECGGSPTAVGKRLNIEPCNIMHRRRRLERNGYFLPTNPLPGGHNAPTALVRNYEQMAPLAVPYGTVVVFSDAHWWPGTPRTIAHDALLKVIREVKPKAVIANGDVFDGASISRHDPDGWQNLPSVHQELETVKAYMAEIAEAARGAILARTIGNHDLRFDRRLATQVPDYRHLAGMMLRDHMPDWREAWAFEVNGGTVVKHRWHNGVHGAYNNVLKAGRSIVTGHLHRLCATPWTDYSGRRYGVDTGTLSEARFAQFDYAEASPKNWGSGFAVLTFREGFMLPPEFCEVLRGQAFWRGEVIHEEAKPAHRANSRPRAAASRPGHRVKSGVSKLRGGMGGGEDKAAARVQMPGLRTKGGTAKR